ncbi:hypothetical protein GJ496_005251 [Pomphorhynchus laevis]|nr:hypothetical protein GJ496_005251 [Pomphorhynchus laevis]
MTSEVLWSMELSRQSRRSSRLLVYNENKICIFVSQMTATLNPSPKHVIENDQLLNNDNTISYAVLSVCGDLTFNQDINDRDENKHENCGNDPAPIRHLQIDSTTDNTSVHVLAIYEKKNCSIGLAFIDERMTVLVTCEIFDSAPFCKVIAKLASIDCSQLLFAQSSNLFKYNLMIKTIQNESLPIKLIEVPRNTFNDCKGVELIKCLCIPDSETVLSEVSNRSTCLSCCSALLTYVSQDFIHQPKSIRLQFEAADKTVLMNAYGCYGLMLFGSSSSLFSVLNKTTTKPGARLLKRILLQPSCDLETIEDRLDAVEELMADAGIINLLETQLLSFPDVDKALTSFARKKKADSQCDCEKTISDAICLKQCINEIIQLRSILNSGRLKSRIFKDYILKALCEPSVEQIRQIISNIIHEDAHIEAGVLPMRTQKCYAVKPGVDCVLDVARKSYSEINTWINFDLNTNLAVANAQAEDQTLCLKTFTVVVQKLKYLLLSTRELIRMSNRSENAITDVFKISSRVIIEALIETNELFQCLHSLIDSIALLDVLLSFAVVARLRRYTRPQFQCSEASSPFCIEFVNSRSPILDLSNKCTIMANDVYAHVQNSPLTVLSGPNMTGKSTYLRQIGQLVIMAQCGSFIPADKANMSIVKQLFSRIDNNICLNPSTAIDNANFNEMKEIGFMIQCSCTSRSACSSSNSLVLLDEACRGFPSDIAFSLSFAILEQLMLSKHTLTFTSTHRSDQLCWLGSLYPQMMECQMNENFRLCSGFCNKPNYGLDFAEKLGFPSHIIESARNFSASALPTLGMVKLNLSKDLKKRALAVRLWREAKERMSQNKDTTDLKMMLEQEFSKLQNSDL